MKFKKNGFTGTISMNINNIDGTNPNCARIAYSVSVTASNGESIFWEHLLDTTFREEILI